jgi:hypothetical protein
MIKVRLALGTSLVMIRLLGVDGNEIDYKEEIFIEKFRWKNSLHFHDHSYECCTDLLPEPPFFEVFSPISYNC